MQTRLFVGNLSFEAKEDDLKAFFEAAGQVQSVSIIINRKNKRPKGYAFVEMANSEAAEKAIEMNGREFMGRNLIVAEANPREEKSFRRKNKRKFRGPRRGFGRGHKRETVAQKETSWMGKLVNWVKSPFGQSKSSDKNERPKSQPPVRQSFGSVRPKKW